MHHLLLSVLLYYIPSVSGVGNDTTPTSSPSSTSNNEQQQLQLTDVSAICDPAIAAITAWLVLVIVSSFEEYVHFVVYSVKIISYV